MPISQRFAVAVIALSALAACSRSTPPRDASLQRDLDLAGGQGIELAPQGSARATISTDELIPAGNRRPATIARAKAPARQASTPTPTPETRVAEQAVPSSANRDSAIAPAPATPRPSTRNAVSPPPPGGYKTMGELIRKAPFPINP
jgi:hypothetical protein